MAQLSTALKMFRWYYIMLKAVTDESSALQITEQKDSLYEYK